MSNSEVLRLVKSVVPDRDLIAVMTHFHMYGGRIQGGNGRMAIEAPWVDFPSDEPISVPADPLVKAFEAMADPKITITPGGKLKVSEGRMRVQIPISTEKYYLAEKPADFVPFDDSVLRTMRKVRPFVSEDASRPWAMGVLIRDGYLYATNNVVMVRKRVDTDLEFSLPGYAIDQLSRYQKKVEGIHVEPNHVTFTMEGDTWFQSNRYAEQWPDVTKFFEGMEEVGPELTGKELAAVQKVLPFVPDKRHPVIRFVGNKVATLSGDMEAEIETDNDYQEANFHAVPLQLVLGVATHMDFTKYPQPVPFWNPADGLEGVFVGVRL